MLAAIDRFYKQHRANQMEGILFFDAVCVSAVDYAQQ